MFRGKGAVGVAEEKFAHDSQALAAFNAGLQDPMPQASRDKRNIEDVQGARSTGAGSRTIASQPRPKSPPLPRYHHLFH